MRKLERTLISQLRKTTFAADTEPLLVTRTIYVHEPGQAALKAIM